MLSILAALLSFVAAGASASASTSLGYGAQEELVFTKLLGYGAHGYAYSGRWHDKEVTIKLVPVTWRKRNTEARGFSATEVQAMRDLAGASRVVSVYALGRCTLANEPTTDGALPVIRTLLPMEGTNEGIPEVDGVYDFAIMELLPRGSLPHMIKLARDGRGDGRGDARRKEGRAWPWAARLRILRDVAEGMAQIHARRYVHRDLKPDNVLIDADGRAKITDLALVLPWARMPTRGNLQCAGYISPEDVANSVDSAIAHLVSANAPGYPAIEEKERRVDDVLAAYGWGANATSTAAAWARERSEAYAERSPHTHDAYMPVKILQNTLFTDRTALHFHSYGPGPHSC